MKTKTINKIIQNKMVDWLATITNEQLAKDLAGNIMVSGGCIANMLLNEKVNDYDVYIKDIDVAYRLAQYYVPLGTEVLDGRKKKEYLDEFNGRYPEIDPEDKALNMRHANILGLNPDQVKISTLGSSLNDGATDEELKKYIPVFISPNAISLSNDIQIVFRFTGTIEEIHKNYDFVHATNYWTMETKCVFNNEALLCLLTKTLKYQGSRYPVTSIIRVKKFTNRGFTISAGEQLKMMYQVSKLDLDRADVLYEQLIGVDIAYFGTMIEILRNSNMKTFTFEYLSNIIEKVFTDSVEND